MMLSHGSGPAGFRRNRAWPSPKTNRNQLTHTRWRASPGANKAKQDKGTAVQIIMYSIWTIIASIIPVFGFTGDLKLSIVGAILVTLLGLVMLFYAFKLFKKRSVKVAKQLMLSSVFYITMLQIIYVFSIKIDFPLFFERGL